MFVASFENIGVDVLKHHIAPCLVPYERCRMSSVSKQCLKAFPIVLGMIKRGKTKKQRKEQGWNSATKNKGKWSENEINLLIKLQTSN